MKTSTWYLVLAILDVILLIAWPVCIFMVSYPAWAAFLIGAIWYSDIMDLIKHIANYKEAKFYEGFKEV